MEKQKKEEFEKLFNINVNEKTEQKNGLTYLSWAWAWAEFKKVYPDANYEIVKNENNLPYFADQSGIMCYTRVTAGGQTYEMWLPVMDATNNAMKFETYSFKVWNRYEKQWVEKVVAAATMFDINKTIMRCLVKNLAMFGLGLYIYAGEDLPEDEEKNKQNVQNGKQVKAAPQKAAAKVVKNTPTPDSLKVEENDQYANIKQILNSLNTIDEMMEIYNQHKEEVESNPDIKNLFGIRKAEIKAKTA